MYQNTLPSIIYYSRFKIVIGTPLWRVYLRWAYKKCIEDFSKLNYYPDFNGRDFTALLCGVGNEVTADEFINFVTTKNERAKIIIIDIGKQQIDVVTKLVQNKYASLDIKIKQTNALALSSFLSNNSIDWIETDGFLEYFDKSNLHTLLNIWKKLMKVDGFITVRECASSGIIGGMIDYLRVLIAKKWLGVTLYKHTRIELEKMLSKNQFSFVSGTTPLPTFKRYSMIKFH